MEILHQFSKLFVLDIRNTMGILFWGNFTLAILVFSFRFTSMSKQSHKQLLVFGCSKILLAIAWLSFFLRVDTLSYNPIQFIITNTLVFSGYYLESLAMLMIIKKSTRKMYQNQLFIFIATLLSFYIAVALQAPANIRVSLASINIFTLFIVPTTLFLRESKDSMFRRILGLNYIILLTTLIFRIIYPLFNSSTSLYTIDTTQKIIFLIIFLMMTISGVGYLLLLQEKKEKQVKKLLDDKNQFFSIIAHDLKGPFNGIIGLTELLLEKENNDINKEETNEFIELIHQSTKNTFSLLDNLLTWSQSQSGLLEFTPKKTDISSIIDKTIHLLSNIAKSKNITIHSTIEKNQFINADKNMLETVFRNLISNALKFTNNNGEVILSMKKDENQIVFSIQDNGIGIPQGKTISLFAINKKKNTLGTNNESGTGLGLAICKDFIERHGGKIWVHSQIGQGSTFKFNIPVIN